MAVMTERARTARTASLAGRALALVAAGTLVVAMFLPWTGDDRLALDLGLSSLGESSSHPTVAVALVALAAITSLAALVGNHPVPRIVSAGGAVLMVLLWLGAGPDGALAPGIVAGIVGIVLLAFSAALGRRSPAEPGGSPPEAGFRQLDHTADIAIEAWGPSRAACLEAAVTGLVTSFADTEGTEPQRRHAVSFGPGDHEDLLVDLLDEVIYLLDARRAVVVDVALRDTETGGIEGTLALAPADNVRMVGAVPKAVTYHGLRLEQAEDGTWRSHVIIDV